MKPLPFATALLFSIAAPALSQSTYDSAPALRPPAGTVIPWEALNRLGAVHTEPYQASPAIISMFLVCRIVTVSNPFNDDTQEFESCDPVLVWCPQRGEECTTIE